MSPEERRLYAQRPWMLPENEHLRCTVPTKHRGDAKRCYNRVEHAGRCAVHLRLVQKKIAVFLARAADVPIEAIYTERRDDLLAVVFDRDHLTEEKVRALRPAVAKLGALMREAGATNLTVLTA